MKYAKIDKKTGEVLNVVQVDTCDFVLSGDYDWVEISLYNLNVGSIYKDGKFFYKDLPDREIAKEKTPNEKIDNLEIENEKQKETNTTLENISIDNTEMLVDLQYQIDMNSIGGI